MYHITNLGEYINWDPRNKLQGNLKQNAKILFRWNSFDYVVCKSPAVMFSPQCVPAKKETACALLTHWTGLPNTRLCCTVLCLVDCVTVSLPSPSCLASGLFQSIPVKLPWIFPGKSMGLLEISRVTSQVCVSGLWKLPTGLPLAQNQLQTRLPLIHIQIIQPLSERTRGRTWGRLRVRIRSVEKRWSWKFYPAAQNFTNCMLFWNAHIFKTI